MDIAVKIERFQIKWNVLNLKSTLMFAQDLKTNLSQDQAWNLFFNTFPYKVNLHLNVYLH